MPEIRTETRMKPKPGYFNRVAILKIRQFQFSQALITLIRVFIFYLHRKYYIFNKSIFKNLLILNRNRILS